MDCRLPLAAALAHVAICLPASAACLYKPFEFHPEKNGGVVVTSIVDSGASCTHNFAEGKGYHFDSVAIDRAPDHGELKQTGPTRFVYQPSPDYSGKDAYIFKICATKGKKSGCAAIAFLAQVRAAR